MKRFLGSIILENRFGPTMLRELDGEERNMKWKPGLYTGLHGLGLSRITGTLFWCFEDYVLYIRVRGYI